MLNVLEDIVNKKTTWGTKALTDELSKAFLNTTMDRHTSIIYGQVLHNFDVYVKEKNISSIGRNEFKRWLHSEVANQKALYPTTEQTDTLKHIATGQKIDAAWQAKLDSIYTPSYTRHESVAQGATNTADLIEENKRLKEENELLKSCVNSVREYVAKADRTMQSLRDLLSASDTY